MRTRAAGSVFAICAALLLLAGTSDVLAREGREKKPRKPRVVGAVAVTKEGDEIKGVTLTEKKKGEEVVYTVELDEKGKQLGQELDGKRAMVMGDITEEGGKKTIKVERFRELKARPKKPKPE